MRIRERFRQILLLKESPKRLAASFAVGVFIGVSPLIGAHTLLGFVVSYLFRLNKPVTLTGVYVTNPWTVVPIYTFTTWTGAKMLGTDFLTSEFDVSALTFNMLMSELSHLFKPFLIGSTLVAVLAALILYPLMYKVFKKFNDA